MRQACWLAAAIVVGIAGVARAESYSIVQLSDMDRDVSVQVMNSTELRDLKKRLESEAKFFPKAKEAAAKEWAARIVAERKADNKNAPKTLPFPSSQLRAREIRVMPRTFMDKDEADKAVQVLERQAANKKDQEKKTAKPVAKDVAHEKEINLRDARDLLQVKIADLIKGAGGGEVGAK